VIDEDFCGFVNFGMRNQMISECVSARLINETTYGCLAHNGEFLERKNKQSMEDDIMYDKAVEEIKEIFRKNLLNLEFQAEPIYDEKLDKELEDFLKRFEEGMIKNNS